MADVRASVKRMRREGERLVERIQRDVRSLATRGRSQVLGDTRKLRQDFQSRAKRAFRDLETARGRMVATFEKRVTVLVQTVVKQLHAATKEQLATLEQRVVGLEKRAEDLERRLRERATSQQVA